MQGVQSHTTPMSPSMDITPVSPSKDLCDFTDAGDTRCLSLCQALPDPSGQEAAPSVFL